MRDRLLSRCLWLVIMSMIAGSAIGGILLIYAGLFKLIISQFEQAGFLVGWGLILAGACWVLCRHCDDLIDRVH
jgi:hypothetical protein